MNTIKEWNHLPKEARPKVRYWVPAAAMDEADLRLELKQLQERGFGGVEVVTLASMPEVVMKGDDGWGTKNWNHMVKIIADTTRELGMTMDLANGPMWPISMPTIQNADDPAALCELTYGIVECPLDGHYRGLLPRRRKIHEEGTVKLVHVLAYLEISEKILKQDSYVDLSAHVSGKGQNAVLECELPPAKEGTKWLIFAFYSQPAVHKTGMNQFYVVDHLSVAGAKACEKYWDKIMPEYDNYPSMESFFCDSLEYCVMMEWTPQFLQEFEVRRGYSPLPYLPFMGKKIFYPESDIPGYHLENQAISDMINHDYFETLTQCYCENHLEVLEKMAKKYGKGIRYQVAYNKPFEGERCPLYVEIPENEALGRPAMDYQKTMAAAAHLGRKKRYSFECAAEFGNSYGQNYEDLMWWVKRSLMSGMNAQVLHGASYNGSYHGKYSLNGAMQGVQWPGYEAFGKVVSNYWNRTLSIEDSKGCLDMMARLNSIFQKKAKVDCAIFRQSYENEGLGSEFCFYEDEGELSNRGYSYETVSTFLLSLPVCTVEDGILDKDGVGYKCLIIPEQKFVASKLLQRIDELLMDNFKIFWVGKRPEYGLFFGEWDNDEKREQWNKKLQKVWTNPKLIHVATNARVPDALAEEKIYPNVMLKGDMNLISATRVNENANIKYYAIYGYNKIVFSPDQQNPDEILCSALYKKGTTKGTYERPGASSRRQIEVKLKGIGTVYSCNPWSGKLRELSFKETDGYLAGIISIEEDELVLLAVFENEMNQKGKNPITLTPKVEQESEEIHIALERLELQAFVPDTEGETSFFRSHFTENIRVYELNQLVPWHELDHSLKKFAGKGIYYGTIVADRIDEKSCYFLNLGNVSDTFRVWVNQKKTDFPDQVQKEVEITSLLREAC